MSESIRDHKPLQNQTLQYFRIRRSNCFQRRTGLVIERRLRNKGEKRVDLACCGERAECLVTSPLSLSWGKSSDTAYQAPTTFDCDVRRSATTATTLLHRMFRGHYYFFCVSKLDDEIARSTLTGVKRISTL